MRGFEHATEVFGCLFVRFPRVWLSLCPRSPCMVVFSSQLKINNLENMKLASK